jgi:prepilin-type N-terminal cleavage/methylation domain-containing protein
MIRRSNRGFTLVELMVTMSVGSILVVAAVALYLVVLSQVPLMQARNTLTTNIQSALNRINDDVRQSSNIALYNQVADPNAPTAKTGYENVPGPTPDTDDKNFWRMGESRLLLNQTPVKTNGDPIYDNPQYAVGSKNTIIYYVRDGALYRRVIAAAYGTNSITTAACTPRVAVGGCIDKDIKVISNLKASLGDAAFKITYYDKNGNTIGYSFNNGSGTPVPDYGGFPLARAIGVTIQLESGEIVGSQKVAVSNTGRMQFRSNVNVVPPPVVNPPYVPPTNGLGDPALMVGPGGLIAPNSVVIQGGDAYIKGKVTLGFASRMGGGSFFSYPYLPNNIPINLNVGNVACGTGASFPSPCGASSPPIDATAPFAEINGRVCAKDQLDPVNIHPVGASGGFIPGCVPPDSDLPAFDKAAFTAGMTNGISPGSLGSCAGGGFSSATLQANRTYTGNVDIGVFCSWTINGSGYITGNLTTSNADIKVAESAGRVRPVIVVNGKINMNTFGSVRPNSYGTTPYFISFFSADSACSNSPSCNSITPQKLKETLDNYSGAASPINLSNATASGSSFYAYFGEVNSDFFTTVGALAGQRVRMGVFTNMLMNGTL